MPVHCCQCYPISQVESALPTLDERIAFATGNKVIGHDRRIHDRSANLIWRAWVSELIPANAIKVADQYVPSVHIDSTMRVQACSSEEIGAMRPDVHSSHGSFDKRLWEQVGWDVFQGIGR